MQIHYVKRAALAAAFLIASCLGASAQPGGGVRQNGAVTPSDCTSWLTNNVIQDSGVACSAGGFGFPITLGTTSIAANSTTTSVTGLSIAAGSNNSGAFAGTLAWQSNGAISAAFGTTGVSLIGNAYTQTDSTTGAGTVAAAYGSLIGANTFATAANAITITNGYNVYIAAPVAGSHVTGTNLFALGVDSLSAVNGALANGTNLGFGGNGAVAVTNVGTYGWTSGGVTAAYQTVLSSPGAAIIQFGKADAAAPVAQTIQVQNAVGGTSNANGANWTQIGSLATGSGTPGDYIIKTGFQGIASTGTVTFSNGSANITYTSAMAVNQAVQFTTTGALPTNFATATTYYVVSNSGTVLTVSATVGGSAIVAGSAGSGTQTILTATVQQPAITAAILKGGTQQFQALSGTDALPGIAVTADSSTGFKILSGSIGVSISGTNRWNFSGNFAGGASNSPALVNSAASSTVPTLIPNRGDTTTGWGAQASGNISAIAGGAEISRFTSVGYLGLIAGTAAAPSLAVLNANTGLYSTSTGANLGISIGGAVKADWAITTGATWTFGTALTINNATFKVTSLGVATAVDTVCYASATGLFTEEPTGTTCTVSARRFKQGIVAQNIDHDYSVIMGVKPVSFRFKKGVGQDDGAEVHHGLIAEDMEKLAPELVSYEKDGQTHGIKYGDGELQSYIIGAIQKQDQMIKALKIENARLHTANDNLKAQESRFDERLGALEHPKRKMASLK